MANKHYTLHIAFRNLEDLLDFAKQTLPGTVYEADALDPEVGGRAMKNSFVVRTDGHKPDQMKATA